MHPVVVILTLLFHNLFYLYHPTVINLTGQFYNFEKYGHGKLDEMNVEYDFSSIMHYGNKAFSKNKKPTILSVSDPSMPLGSQNERHSVQDWIEINALYDCENKPGM